MRALFAGLLLLAPVAGFADSGKVTHASAKRAYLDAGKDDGLAAGQELTLLRRGKPLGKCVVTALSEHRTACDVLGAREGDTFSYSPPQKPAPAVRELPEVPSKAELARRNAAVSDAPVPKVEFAGGAGQVVGLVRRVGASAALVHATWASPQSAAGPFHEERLELRLSGVALPLGMKLRADATALAWTRRPLATRQPTRQYQLVVQRLEVQGPSTGALRISAGRLWPGHAASAGAVDGVQAGWRSGDDSVEVGVLAGTVPESWEVMPTFNRPLLGGYASYVTRSSAGPIRWSQHEARVTVAFGQASGTRTELGLLSRADVSNTLQLLGDVRVAADGLGVGVDGASAGVDWQPTLGLRVRGGGRYSQGRTEVLAGPGALPGGAPAWHADLGISYDLGPVTLGANADAARDITSGLSRYEAGPELSWSSSAGAFGVGYRYGVGPLGGHAGYLQYAGQLGKVRTFARGSYFGATTGSGVLPEGGLYLSVDYPITAWLSARASGFARIPFSRGAFEEDAGPIPAALNGSGAVVAQF